jgi:hypothetical protein
MIIPAIRLVTKAATIIAIANTGYKAYKKGKVVYDAYKKTKKAQAVVGDAIKGVKKVIKKK